MAAAYAAWLIPLAIGVAFGCCWGFAAGQRSAPPTVVIRSEGEGDAPTSDAQT